MPVLPGTGTGVGTGIGTGVGTGKGSSTGSGSGSSTGTGSGSGSSTGTGSGSGASCRIPPGTYTEVTNVGTADGGPGCPPPNFVVTYPLPPVDAGLDSGPDPCTVMTDTATCTWTAKCVIDSAGGYITNVDATQTVSASGAVSGIVSTSTEKPADAGVLTACAYTYTWVAGTGTGSGS